MLLSRGEFRLVVPLIAAVTATAVLGPVVSAHADPRQQHVVVLYSMRPSAQLAVVLDRELPSLLRRGLSQEVDYYPEYIDTSRFSHAEYQRSYRDFLRLKYKTQRIDLLIAVGDDATEFLVINRHAIFPSTPVVFYMLQPPRVRLRNSTGLVNELHFDRSLDLSVALQPDLKRVYVVSGANTDDQRYERQARRQFSRFNGRLQFTYFSGLVTRDLETRLRNLPPHSAVHVIFVTRDGAGANFEWVPYLARIAAAAAAPTYSWTDASVGTGIVGGNRRDQLAETKAIAALALRVLRGAHADDIPVATLNFDTNQVDTRQLRRWNIDEARVPAGVVVLFREPSLWGRFKNYVIGSVSLLFAQTALIAGLLVQRTKRRRIELQLRESQTQLRASHDHIQDLGRRLLEEQEAERARIARELHDDISQRLALLEIDLEQFRRTGKLTGTARTAVDAFSDAAAQISSDIRALSQQLHPPTLAIRRLDLAINGLCRQLAKRYHLQVQFTCNIVPEQLDHVVSRCFFRIAQEALHNVAKHSGAMTAIADLSVLDGSLVLSVSDKGAGFDPNALGEHTGLGLIGMRERLQLLGGELMIRSKRGAGTLIRAQCPIPEYVPTPQRDDHCHTVPTELFERVGS